MKLLKYFSLGGSNKMQANEQKKPKEKALLAFFFFVCVCDIVPLIPESIAGVAMVIYFSF